MAKQTKKQKALAEKLGDNQKLYGVGEALTTLRELSSAKFDETVEVALNLGVDPRHADQMVRGMVTLPSGTGKDVKVAVFARGNKADEALAAGADRVGAEDLMEEMQAGNVDYGRVIATPDMMGIVGRLGKLLGPKGLMPTRSSAPSRPTSPRRSRRPRAARWNSASRRPGSSIRGSASCRSRTTR